MEKLTPKQQRFIAEYLIDLNATQAAIRAGYSENTAYSIGQENLKKPEIQVALQIAMEERAERCKIDADSVLKEYAKIGFSNIADFAKWTGRSITLIPSSAIDKDKLSVVESVSESITGVKIKMHNKIAGLDALARHLGLDKIDGLVSKMLEEELDAIIASEKGEGGESEEDS